MLPVKLLAVVFWLCVVAHELKISAAFGVPRVAVYNFLQQPRASSSWPRLATAEDDNSQSYKNNNDETSHAEAESISCRSAEAMAQSSKNATTMTMDNINADGSLEVDVVVTRGNHKKKDIRNKNDSEPPSTASEPPCKKLDNRDSLPFRVEHMAPPDPYNKKRQQQTRAQNMSSKQQQQRRRLSSKDTYGSSSLTSSVYTGGDAKTLLGQYMLDKHTTTGDLLEIGDTQYKVTRHKCQYKYAGGNQFVMVKKILQVKEVGRLMREEYLTRQWEQSSPSSSSGGDELL